MQRLILFILLSVKIYSEEFPNILFLGTKTDSGIGFFSYSEKEKKTRAGLQARAFIPIIHNTKLLGLGGIYSEPKKVNRWTYFGNKEEEINQTSYFGLTGLEYKFFKLYLGRKMNPNIADVYGVGIQVFKEKSIHFLVSDSREENFKESAISFLNGGQVFIGLELGKQFRDNEYYYRGSIAIGTRLENLELKAILNTENGEKRSANLSGFLSIRETNSENLLEELNPILPETEPKFKKPIPPKNLRLNFFRKNKKETKIYKLTVNELLKAKIPIQQAVSISNASEDSEKYQSLIKTLPKEIQRACYYLQKTKQEVEP
ncbi:MAG: hypothetical protein SFU98_03515 [Leptospiraceae bacterium]|nr:hypothetical protein [Leptospiraceae bacterium]